MGASVIGYWPGITEMDLEDQPGFWNDCKAWGNWMAERESEPEVKRTIVELGAAPILTFTTDGVDDSEVEWVTPQQLYLSALSLKEAIIEGKPGVYAILESYERNAHCVDPVAEEFVRDLEDIGEIALWAEKRGINRMTLEVNW
jgi:hypothetical protein